MTARVAPSLTVVGGEALRFAGVGGVATLIHLGLALVAHAAGLSPLAANAAAFLGAFLFSWAGHARWTFAVRDVGAGTLPRFFVVSFLALCLGQVAVWLVVERAGLPFLAGLAAVVATVPLATFLGARAWAFAEDAPAIRPDLFAAFTIVALVASYHTTLPLNHDVAWLLTGADRLLNGATFGAGVEDVTPPWAWWLLVPVAYAARIPDLGSSGAVALFVACLATASLFACARLLPRGGWPLPALAVTVMLAAGYDWAQREHLFAIAILPWILLIAHRTGGRTVSAAFAVAVGALASVGLLQKPHFLLVPIALEVWFVLSTWRTHRWSALKPRPESLILVLAGLLYVVAALAWASPWFAEVLPRMLVAYGAYANDPWLVAQVTSKAALLPLLLVAAFHTGLDARARAFLVAGAGAALAAILQSKGWSYHLLPLLTFAILAAILTIAGSDRAPTLRLAAMLVLAMVAVRPSLVLPDAGVATFALAGTMRSGDTVMAFNTSPRTVHPAVRHSGAEWVGRAGNLHFVPGAVARGASPEAVAIGRDQGLAVLARLEAAPPQILLVDDRSGKLGLPTDHDWLAWFEALAPARFPALLGRYAERPSRVGYRVFELKLAP